MLELNRVVLAGKCKDTPEIIWCPEKTAGGTIAKLILIVDNTEVPLFFEGLDIVNNCNRYLKKGMHIIIEGKIIEYEGEMCIKVGNVAFLENVNKKKEI
ncbi:MAG: hypothetical protein J6Y02_04480 [Pseudobutyrivibrio sp.]|nr:hypothetical protein [Pseudobutyrivibrio sp.]